MRTTNVDDVYDLTPLQHGMLFHALYAPRDGVYIEQTVLTLRGELDAAAFWAAWQYVVARHDALRTTFHWDTIDKPVQVVHRQARLPEEEIDWRGLADSGQGKLLREALLAERRAGFDLDVRPPVRVTLYRLADDRYQVGLRFSHLILDGWSIGIILSDFTAAYRALRHGGPPDLPAAGHFRDYVAWWKRQIPDETEAFWRSRLADFRGTPVLRRSGAGDSREGVPYSWHEVPLSDLAGALRAYSARHRVSVHTLAQGAWTLVLGRNLPAPDLAVGTTMAHRPATLPAGDSTVGCMVVTIPVRAQVGGDAGSPDWLRSLQEAVTAGREHAAADLTAIRRWSSVPAGGELFESIVTVQNMPLPAFGLGSEGLELLGVAMDTRPHLPLVLMVLPGDDMPMRLVYDQRRLSAEQAQGLLDQTRRALASIVTSSIAEVAVPHVALVPPVPALEGPRATHPLPGRPRTETEQRLARVLAELLQLDDVAVDENLVDLGLHSLLGTRAAHRIDDIWRTPIPLRMLFEQPTVAQLAAIIEAGGVLGAEQDRAEEIDLPAEAVLPPGFGVSQADAGPVPAGQAARILVTGATGYLGTALLGELLRTTTAHLYCLVRGDDPDAAASRIRDALAAAGRWRPADAERITAMPGNLAQPCLGLSPAQFGTLATEINAIYHLGAVVNVMPPYRRVRAVNVDGMREILRLAVTGQVKRLHYVSPAELSEHSDQSRNGRESPLTPEPAGLYNGYAQSKWVAERMAAQAQQQGLPVTVYRAARLIGSPESGLWKLGDVVSELARACIALELVPSADVRVPVSPVDYVAAAICRISRQDASAGRYYHLTAARPFVFDDLARAMAMLGYPVRRAGLRTWYAELVRLAQRDGSSRWGLVLSVLGPWVRAVTSGWSEPDYDTTAARTLLGADLAPPAMGTAELARCLRYLRESGFIPSAAASSLVTVDRDPARDRDGEGDVLRQWEAVYDGLYAGLTSPFAGWVSSYDGSPIPLPQMREWRDAAVARIRSLRPRRVLEIGAGSGLILREVAPECEQYWATDISGAAADLLAREVAADERLRAVVAVRQQAAHDVGGLPDGFFDTIVLNSVIQYFPSERYLAEVIDAAIALLAPGGIVFLGDVRNLRLWRCLRTAIRLRAAGRRPVEPGVLMAQASRDMDLDSELLVDPDYFAAWQQAEPGYRSADIRIKDGRYANELTRYRYDVLLSARPAPFLPAAARPIDRLDEFAARLAASTGPVRMTGIPNARLAGEIAAMRALDAGGGVAAARRLLRSPAARLGIQPAELRARAERLGYRVAVTWTGDADDGALDVLCARSGWPGDMACGYDPGPPGTRPLTSTPTTLAAGAEPARAMAL